MTAASLKKQLASLKPRDLSGARASNRLTFQKDWSLVLLMHLHEKGDDYLLLLDYHDDVVVVDSSSNPQTASFFQIKTNKGGNWTLTQLTKRPKGKSGPLPSHMGKLWGHQVSFASAECFCYFVTNGMFPFCPSASSDELGENTACQQLGPDDYLELAQAIKTELQLSADPDLKNRLTFVRTPISVTEHALHVSGKLTSFIAKRHPTGKFLAAAAYRAIADEIGRRVDREGSFATFEILCAHKGLSRTEFEGMLQAVGARDDLDAAWSRYEVQLIKDGVVFSELEAIHASWREFEIERMDVSNEELRDLSARARAAISTFVHSTPSFTLTQLVQSCFVSMSPYRSRSEAFVKAAILMEYYFVAKLQTAGPQPKAKAP